MIVFHSATPDFGNYFLCHYTNTEEEHWLMCGLVCPLLPIITQNSDSCSCNFSLLQCHSAPLGKRLLGRGRSRWENYINSL